MQFEDANALEEKWNATHSEPHNDHDWDKEYYLSTRTPDYRCTVCGATQAPSEREALRESSRSPSESNSQA